MPVVSSKGFCDALRSIICIASEQQQQLGTVNAAASVQHIHAISCMHCAIQWHLLSSFQIPSAAVAEKRH